MLTVIIPIYKAEKTLSTCVESIVKQTYRQMEILLVDDGSPDSCPKMCDQWAKTDPRVRVIHKANGGLSSARNAGLNVACGDFITFVDADDYLDTDTYSSAMAMMTGDIDLVEYPIWRFYGSDRQEKLVFENKVYDNATDYWIGGKAYAHSYACNKIYRRKLFYDVRFPEKRIFEDAFTLPLILRKAKRIMTIRKGLYYYCDNPQGITSTADGSGLRQLLDAHLRFAPITDEEYYLHVLNIQLDVARMTGDTPSLNTLRISHPWRMGMKIGLKLSLFNILGLRAMCLIYRLLYIIKK